MRSASSVRISFTASRSTDRSPSSVLTVIGKKQIRAMIRSFGLIPKPNQTTRIGATTMIGTVCEATSSGYTARRAVSERCRATANPTPRTSATRNPARTSRSVTQPFSASSSRSCQSESATSLGAGIR